MYTQTFENRDSHISLSTSTTDREGNGQWMFCIQIAILLAEVGMQRAFVFFLILSMRIEIANTTPKIFFECFDSLPTNIFFWQWKSGDKNIFFFHPIQHETLFYSLCRCKVLNSTFFRMKRSPGTTNIRICTQAKNVPFVSMLFGKKCRDKKGRDKWFWIFIEHLYKMFPPPF